MSFKLIEKPEENIYAELLKMPYYRNYAAASGKVHNISKHEDAVNIIFVNGGLKEWIPNKKLKKNTVEEMIITRQNIIDMPSYSFISQPCGTHGNPDFLVCFNSKIFGFECKSTTGCNYCPMYNSGGIKPNIIYIFSNEKCNETTLYLGSDIITEAQNDLIDELIHKQRQLETEYNERLKELDITGRGVSYYTRPMINQTGDSTKTNYFKHANREMCEKNVLKCLLS